MRHAFLHRLSPACDSLHVWTHPRGTAWAANLLADTKTARFFQALAEVYCRRRSVFFRRMRATLGLACAQAPTLCTQVVVFSVCVFFLLVLSVRWNSLEARRGEDSAAQLEALCA